MSNFKYRIRGCAYICAVLVFAGCQSEKKDAHNERNTTDTQLINDTTVVESSVAEPAKTYENTRFRNVSVTAVNDSIFSIEGQAQIFEATFGWFIEDGHNILDEGFEMTDAGAPEWGHFKFVVAAKKERANSTLHIILYESSARDGSKQHELPIPLK